MRGASVSAAGQFFITPHAVRAYQRRWRRDLSYEDALTELIRISDGARRIKTRRNGAIEFRGPSPARLTLIVSDVRPGLPQLLTVLPRHDGRFP